MPEAAELRDTAADASANANHSFIKNFGGHTWVEDTYRGGYAV